MADFKYPEGSVSPSGKYVVQGGKWVPRQAQAAVKLSSKDQDYLQKAQNEANALQRTTAELDRFMQLNRQAPTGPIYNEKKQGDWLPAFGRMFMGDRLQEMEAINNRLAPQQRVPGSGATSDIEYRGMKMALPNTNLWGTTNQNLAKDIKRYAAEAKARAAFLDRYVQERGTLLGAEEAFDNFYAAQSKQRPAAAPKPKPAAPSGPPRKAQPMNNDPLGLRNR